eukprot:PhF_6_TR3750/c0_g1_i1/m.5416/K04739/PRKAR; cAMP-dependent protein kinase regulator
MLTRLSVDAQGNNALGQHAHGLLSVAMKPHHTRTDVERDILVSFCRRVDAMRNVPQDVIYERVLPYLTHRRLRPNEILLGENEICQTPYAAGFYIILSGIVQMRIMTASSRFAIEIGRGECVGGEVALQNLPPSTYYVAKEVVEALHIPQHVACEFTHIIREHEMEARVKFLQTQLMVPLFSGLDREDIEQVAESLYSLRFPSRCVVIKEKDIGGEMFFIRTGECRVVREIEFTSGSSTSVKLMELATLVPGEYFGELSLLNYDITANGKGRGGSGSNTNSNANVAVTTSKDSLYDRRHETITEEDVFADMGDDDEEDVPSFTNVDTSVMQLKSAMSGGGDSTLSSTRVNTLQQPPPPPVTNLLPRQATVFTHSLVDLYVLSATDFKRVMNPVARKRMEEYAKGYPSSTEVRSHFQKQKTWQNYKQNVLNEVFGPYSRYRASQTTRTDLNDNL